MFQTPMLAELIHFIQTSRRKFIQQGPNPFASSFHSSSVEVSTDCTHLMLTKLSNEHTRWAQAEAEEEGVAPEFSERLSLGVAKTFLNSLFSGASQSKARDVRIGDHGQGWIPRGVISLHVSPHSGFGNALSRLALALRSGNAVVVVESRPQSVVGHFIRELRSVSSSFAERVFVLSADTEELSLITLKHPGLSAVSLRGSTESLHRKLEQLDWSMPRAWSFDGDSVAIFVDETHLAEHLDRLNGFFNRAGLGHPLSPIRVLVPEALEAEIAESIAQNLAKSSARRVPVQVIRNYSLCAEDRFDRTRSGRLFIDTFKYVHEVAKKLQPMDYLSSIQIWGDVEKVQRLSERLSVPLVLKNQTPLELDSEDELLAIAQMGTRKDMGDDLIPWSQFYGNVLKVSSLS